MSSGRVAQRMKPYLSHKHDVNQCTRSRTATRLGTQPHIQPHAHRCTMAASNVLLRHGDHDTVLDWRGHGRRRAPTTEAAATLIPAVPTALIPATTSAASSGVVRPPRRPRCGVTVEATRAPPAVVAVVAPAAATPTTAVSIIAAATPAAPTVAAAPITAVVVTAIAIPARAAWATGEIHVRRAGRVGRRDVLAVSTGLYGRGQAREGMRINAVAAAG